MNGAPLKDNGDTAEALAALASNYVEFFIHRLLIQADGVYGGFEKV